MSLQLLESVLNLLDRVKEETGKEVLLFENKNMAAMIEAKIAKEGDKNHLIAYSDKHTPEINHLIASKALQILRINKVPVASRKTAVAYQEHLNNAKMSIALEVNQKPHLEIALNDPQLTSTWTLSLINQLISQPADINIEGEIYRDFPELREYQRSVISAQFKDFNTTLSKEVENLSPTIIYNSSAIMNYVYLKSIDRITGSDFINSLNYIVKKNRCETLYNYTLENLKDSVESDKEIIDYWASFFNITQWFKWVESKDA